MQARGGNGKVICHADVATILFEVNWGRGTASSFPQALGLKLDEGIDVSDLINHRCIVGWISVMAMVCREGECYPFSKHPSWRATVEPLATSSFLQDFTSEQLQAVLVLLRHRPRMSSWAKLWSGHPEMSRESLRPAACTSALRCGARSQKVSFPRS